ncbi:unknown [Clostridium sp. CAG:921]|nr:unknown [Clostridium sp. CAG:921]
MNKVHIKKDRGISIITLTILVIVVVMVISAVVSTLMRQRAVNSTYEATIKIDLQNMSDEYDIAYQKALYSTDGDYKKINDADLYGVISNKWYEKCVATKNGIVYLENNKRIISYIESFQNIISLESKKNQDKICITNVKSSASSIDFNVLVNDSFNEKFRYIYAFKLKGEQTWKVYSSNSYKITIQNLKAGASYYIKVIAKDINEYYVSKSYVVSING